jgi:two-component system, NtrC family, response regulator HydG
MTDRDPVMSAAPRDASPCLDRLLAQAIVVLRAEAQAREGLERLLAQAFGLVHPSIHLTGEPLDLTAGRGLVPGGTETLRVTAAAGRTSLSAAEPALALLQALEPLLRDAERKADTRHALHAMTRDQGDLLGATPVMRQLHERIARAARKNFIVLIEGESGSGKELVARRVHALSDRRDGPFVPLNCAAIVESLLEAELFGIEERTATGVRGRRGKFEQADGGTLFLDEVSDLSSSAQAKLLRVIQDPTVERVGGHGSRRVDVRIVVATNRPLEALSRSGDFRRDLFYRLNAIEITVPPLRARRDDLPFLVEAILQRSAGGQPYRLSGDALEALMVYEWPGNVRELERVIERAITLAQSHVIQVADLPEAVTGRYLDAFQPSDCGDNSMRAWGSRYAHFILRQAGGNKREACRVLDISYHTLCAYLAYAGSRRNKARSADTRPAAQPDATPLATTAPAGYETRRPQPQKGVDVLHDGPAPRLDT